MHIKDHLSFQIEQALIVFPNSVTSHSVQKNTVECSWPECERCIVFFEIVHLFVWKHQDIRLLLLWTDKQIYWNKKEAASK